MSFGNTFEISFSKFLAADTKPPNSDFQTRRFQHQRRLKHFPVLTTVLKFGFLIQSLIRNKNYTVLKLLFVGLSLTPVKRVERLLFFIRMLVLYLITVLRVARDDSRNRIISRISTLSVKRLMLVLCST